MLFLLRVTFYGKRKDLEKKVCGCSYIIFLAQNQCIIAVSHYRTQGDRLHATGTLSKTVLVAFLRWEMAPAAVVCRYLTDPDELISEVRLVGTIFSGKFYPSMTQTMSSEGYRRVKAEAPVKPDTLGKKILQTKKLNTGHVFYSGEKKDGNVWRCQIQTVGAVAWYLILTAVIAVHRYLWHNWVWMWILRGQSCCFVGEEVIILGFESYMRNSGFMQGYHLWTRVFFFASSTSNNNKQTVTFPPNRWSDMSGLSHLHWVMRY